MTKSKLSCKILQVQTSHEFFLSLITQKFSKSTASIYFLSSVMHEKFLSPNKSENFLSPKNSKSKKFRNFSKSKKYNASTIANFPVSLENFTNCLTILNIDCCSPTFVHLFSALSYIHTAHTAYILYFKFPLITHK